MSNKFYVTTPLYYVNASPHIGHSYTNIAADVLARFYRNRGHDVCLLTGTDEHGQKIAKAAAAQNLGPLEFADIMAEHFKKLWENLQINYDDFIRTTESRHQNTVRWILDFLYKKGDIYQDVYSGWYCVPCESFWVKEQLKDDRCPDCNRDVEYITETNYFFKLSKYQDWLLDYIKSHHDFIKPDSRKNEVMSFLENNELCDLCVSRPRERLSWGIPTSFSEGHVTYVWFDALINYISAVGFSYDEEKFKKWWPADIHLIGKDILRQHAIYWPIMLHSLGLEPPGMIFAHGWWLSSDRGESQKISKSKGNIVNPLDIIGAYGIDAYRYFLLREVPFGADGVFDEGSLRKRYNSDLANDLGNLIHRAFTMVEKYCSGKVPSVSNGPGFSQDPLLEKAKDLPRKLDVVMPKVDFHSCLAEIWEVINSANKYIEDTKPWQLSKEGKDSQLEFFLFVLIETIGIIAEEISPYMPQAAAKIISQLKEDKIRKGEPLFPRLEL